MYIEERLESIEKSIEEIKNILLHKVIPIESTKDVKNEIIHSENKEEQAQQKPNKKTKKTDDSIHPVDDKSNVTKLPEGHKIIIGLIDNQAQGPNGEIIAVKISKEPIMNPNTGIAAIKHSFLIEGKYYGTWDANLAKQIMECVDNRRIVKVEYKERPDPKTAGKTFQDIISFKEATADEVGIK